jgi:hypothetical protein
VFSNSGVVRLTKSKMFTSKGFLAYQMISLDFTKRLLTFLEIIMSIGLISGRLTQYSMDSDGWWGDEYSITRPYNAPKVL